MVVICRDTTTDTRRQNHNICISLVTQSLLVQRFSATNLDEVTTTDYSNYEHVSSVTVEIVVNVKN